MKLKGAITPTYYLSILPKRVQRHLTAALAGDRIAAVLAIKAVAAVDQGLMVRAFYDLRMPTDAFRGALATAWVEDRTYVYDAFDANRRLFNKAFRYAAFDIPPFLSRRTPIYRGGYGSAEDMAQGLSWTLDFTAASFFARRYADRPQAPSIVVQRIVTSRSILALMEHRKETEVVVASVGHAVVAGGMEDWLRCAAVYEEEKAEHECDLEVARMILQENDPCLYAATYGQLSEQEAKQ
jgi:hypothetical protein